MIRPKILFLFSIIIFSLPFLPDCVRQVGGESAIGGRWLTPIGSCLYAQKVQQEWVAWYDDPNHKNDNSSGMVVDNTGNVYVTGNSRTDSLLDYFTTVKYSSAGVQLWVRTYYDSGNQDNIPVGISLDSSGNIYVFGYSGYLFSGAIHTILIKYNSTGDTLWVKKYYGTGNSYPQPNSIGNDNRGNTYITGYEPDKLFLLRYNINGDTAWTRYFLPPTGYTAAGGKSLVLDTNGNIFIGGTCNQYTPNGEPSGKFLILKYYTSGTLLWSKIDSSVDNHYDEYINKIALDKQGNIFAAGALSGYMNGTYRYQTAKYNNNGVLQWERVYFQGYDDEAFDLVTDNVGNVYVTGLNSTPGYDYATIKYTQNGDSIWVKRFGYHVGLSTGKNNISIDYNSNIYVIGVSVDSNNNGYITTIKYNYNGTQQWLENYLTGIGSAPSYYVFSDNNFNVYSCSSAIQSGNNLDFITIKYSQLDGIIKENGIAKKFSLVKNYPNPFNPVTNITYEVGIKATIKLSIYNIIGQKVYDFPIQIKDAGIYHEHWDASNFSSGIYFCKMTTNYSENGFSKEFNQTKSMVLLK